MPNVLAPVARQRAMTDLGLIAPGALLHTYVSGTPATPLATTSDAAGLIPNANPLVASAGGLFGPIYLPPGAAYHFVLTDAAGLPIWDQDPVTGGGAAAQVAGDLTVSGLLTVTGFGTHRFVASGTGMQSVKVANTLAGPGAFARISVGNDVNDELGFFQAMSSTFTPNPPSFANGVAVGSSGTAGLMLAAMVGPLVCYAGGTERVRIADTGELLVNTTAVGIGAQVIVLADLTLRRGMAVQNINGTNTGAFLYLINSSAGVAGTISHTGATTVAYNTTSDARLKDDAGPATDLAALRAVVVHDFTWTGEGRRDRGVFAQEAAQVFPRAITAGTDARTAEGHLAAPWMTDYSKFVPDLLVGWQQHDAAIADLRAAVAALMGSR
jgi:hypothetical protein